MFWQWLNIIEGYHFTCVKKWRKNLRDEKLDIIEKVHGPPDWVSPIVITSKKNGDIRICVDMQRANEAIKRERHITPTDDDITSKLNGATVFSKLDMNHGFGIHFLGLFCFLYVLLLAKTCVSYVSFPNFWGLATQMKFK